MRRLFVIALIAAAAISARAETVAGRVFRTVLERNGVGVTTFGVGEDVLLAETAGQAATVHLTMKRGGGAVEKDYRLAPFGRKVLDFTEVREHDPMAVVEIESASAGVVVMSESAQRAPLTLYEMKSLYLAAGDESKTKLLTGFKGASFIEPANGLVLMRERWYDAATGTFLSPDPAGYADSANLDAFCAGNPVACSDPTGNRSELSDDRQMMAAKHAAQDAADRRVADALAMQQANALHRAGTQRMIALRRLGLDVKANDVVYRTANTRTGLTAFGRIVSIGDPIEAEDTQIVLAVTGAQVAAPVVSTAFRAGGVRAAAPIVADEVAGLIIGVNPSIVVNAPRAILNAFEAQRVLADLTFRVNADLAANPALARTVLTQAEYAAGLTRSEIAAAQYGNAVERLVARAINRDPALRQVFDRVGGPNRPDFTAFGRNFDITTETRAQVLRHMKRPRYGDDLIVVTYERPATFTTFPGSR
jgi:RHS repeat-associated protein